jgi:hypothetical protein
MRPSVRISVTVKIDVAACVFALAALLKILL